jgi:hypothetical protein
MPRQSWSDKQERQYQHIKESEEARGQSGRAAEIAARTVNKQRAQTGQARSSSQSKRGRKKS